MINLERILVLLFKDVSASTILSRLSDPNYISAVDYNFISKEMFVKLAFSKAIH